jgi:Ca2+-dependent lipid-binding protein
MASMAVLPNRFLIKLDPTADIFQAYQHPIGVLRLTVHSASELGQSKEGKSFLKRLVHDEPDCYVKVRVGAGPDEAAPVATATKAKSEWWKTKTIKDHRHPEWNETRDFVVSDLDQEITIDVNDEDTANADDDIGIAATTVRLLLAAKDGRVELPLTHKGEPTNGRVIISGKLFRFVPAADTLSVANAGEGRVLGQLVVMVASARGVKGASREETKPSVKVTWGEGYAFRTAIKADAPGVDIENPSWDQAFRVSLVSGGQGVVDGPPVVITLLDGETARGSVEVPLKDVLAAPGLALEKWFDLGGSKVRAGIVLRGLATEEFNIAIR